MYARALDRSRREETKTVGKSRWQIAKRPVSVGQHKCGILCGEIGVRSRHAEYKAEYGVENYQDRKSVV